MPRPPRPASARPWYAAGLRFGCTASGHCCRNHGQYAYVYLTEVEVGALAAHLGIEPAAFQERFCVEDEGWTCLRMDAPACPSLADDGRCGVYAARPVQCRTWPFWEENLKDAERWHGAARVCPGIGRGRRYAAREIAAIAAGNEAWAEGRLPPGAPLPTTDDGPEDGRDRDGRGAQEPGRR